MAGASAGARLEHHFAVFGLGVASRPGVDLVVREHGIRIQLLADFVDELQAR